ncbi:nitrilase-related carbon-nitrogen hydrolase [Bifidobacterium choloepi]|uniref:Glutamine-dependent NAD(+) synthetase n=1 Tax=Bifidobacterium choloepi TaxID=2614131 RepID=A0A6I5NAT8_9BIFI|nr:nitrilase-related carbon-nitrogen hydrolase [Bifidobacterium choloepi]NEG69560.1 hypothetical protein [Bifidobacterium choloepi]
MATMQTAAQSTETETKAESATRAATATQETKPQATATQETKPQATATQATTTQATATQAAEPQTATGGPFSTATMNDGFVRIATASPMSRVANPPRNARLMLETLRRAAGDGANIVAFPEMAMTSYIADDLLYQPLLLESAERSLAWLAGETADLDVLFSVGLPLSVNGKTYNTLAVCHRGRILGIVPKTFIPTYGVDFEGRWFQSGPAAVCPVDVAGQRGVPFGSHQVFRCAGEPALTVGYEICEDIWSPEPPSIRLALAGATVLVNGSASNASLDKDIYRRGLISGQSARLLASYVYVSSGQADSTGDVTVGGQELICDNGTILAESKPFGAGYAIADVDVESLVGARRGMSSFHVAGTPEDAGYHVVDFDMTIGGAAGNSNDSDDSSGTGDSRGSDNSRGSDDSHATAPARGAGLVRPVSRTPFVPPVTGDPTGVTGSVTVRADVCDLAFQMQVHGLLARIRNQKVDHIVVDGAGHDSYLPGIALAVLATVRAAALAGLDADAVTVLAPPEPPAPADSVDTDAAKFLASFSHALGCGFRELPKPGHGPMPHGGHHGARDAGAPKPPTCPAHGAAPHGGHGPDHGPGHGPGHGPFDGTHPLVVLPADMTKLAFGIPTPHPPLPNEFAYMVNSQMARTLVGPVVQRLAVTDGNHTVRVLLESLDCTAGMLEIPDDGNAMADGSFTLMPVEVADFFVDGMLRGHYRPRKTLRLARAAFGDDYDAGQLRDWLGLFLRRYFATQFRRSSLPDGPRLASAGLDLSSGNMFPPFADPSLWLADLQ